MAGIGFELKKLFNKKSAIGYFKAYTYTSIVTTGPFVLMTGMVLSIQLLFHLFDISYFDTQIYIASIIYPFIFSHIIASGFAMLITRYVADRLYSNEYDEIVPSLYGMLSLALGIGAILGVAFFWNKPLAIELKLATYIFYMEMIVIWIQGVYLSALKDYKKIIQSYAGGAFIAVLLAFIVLKSGVLSPVFGAMLSMNIGVFFIASMLMLNIKKFFGKSSYKNFSFLAYFESHFSLFLINLLYSISLYIPNIMIWYGPLGINIAGTYIYAPEYDIATFYAFLSILPVMIMFVVSTEIHFYQKYSTYFMYVTEKGNFKEIEDARQDLLHIMWSEIRNIVEFQLVFTLIFLSLGNYFLPKAGLVHASVNMYNLIVLGAYATGLMQVIITLLLYFEDRKGVLYLSGLFLITNIIFNLGSMGIGENTYGFGFFLSAFFSLVMAICRLTYFTNRLDYFIFCSRPVFCNHRAGFLTKLVNRIYN